MYKLYKYNLHIYYINTQINIHTYIYTYKKQLFSFKYHYLIYLKNLQILKTYNNL